MLKKFHWGHGIMIALASFIIFILAMIFFFPNGQQNSEMVSENYYEDELAFQQIIDAKNNADHLAEKPKYIQNNDGIVIEFPQGISPDGGFVNFNLFRTDDANLDVKKELQLDQNKKIEIPAKILSKGSYTLKISWQENKKPFQIDYNLDWK